MWPEELQYLFDQDCTPGTVIPSEPCKSFTVILKNNGKVQVNLRKHFYVLTKKDGLDGHRMVSWDKMGGFEAAWREAIKLAKPA